MSDKVIDARVADRVELNEYGKDGDFNLRPGQMRFSEAQIQSAMDLVENKKGWSSRRWAAELEEAVTTTQFPYVFGTILNRQLLASYKIFTADWRKFVKEDSALVDFRSKRYFKVLGNDQVLAPVPMSGQYLEAAVSTAYYDLDPIKYGRIFGITFESIINDSLGAFNDIPERFANAVIRTENRKVTETYSSASGPNSGLFGAPITDVDNGQVTNKGTDVLSVATLQRACENIMSQVDVNGEPILARAAVLVVPPALEMTARNILGSQTLLTATGESKTILIGNQNVVAQLSLTLVVDPYLQVVDVSANKKTTWYVFADPMQGAAITMGRVRGYENPEICMRASNKMLVGGGMADVMSGSFENDQVQTRVRSIFGLKAMDPRFCWANDGTGSNT